MYEELINIVLFDDSKSVCDIKSLVTVSFLSSTMTYGGKARIKGWPVQLSPIIPKCALKPALFDSQQSFLKE